MKTKLLVLSVLLVIPASKAFAQKIVDTCNQQSLTVGSTSQFQFMDKKGNLCVGNTASVAPPATTVTLVTLDAKSVTTGGTAVTAINAGNRTAGGWLQNPSTATISLCINELGAATGTTSNGDTYCIAPGQVTRLAASANAVSVIASDASHAFAGYGYK